MAILWEHAWQSRGNIRGSLMGTCVATCVAVSWEQTQYFNLYKYIWSHATSLLVTYRGKPRIL